MTPDELRRDEAGRWLSSAAKDLHAAELLTAEEPTASVFHSQQAVEKSAKAFLTFRGMRFRKTHDIQELGKQCMELNPQLGSLLTDADFLTDYAVVFRYLEAPREPAREEAEEALKMARHVYEEARSLSLSGR